MFDLGLDTFSKTEVAKVHQLKDPNRLHSQFTLLSYEYHSRIYMNSKRMESQHI